MFEAQRSKWRDLFGPMEDEINEAMRVANQKREKQSLKSKLSSLDDV